MFVGPRKLGLIKALAFEISEAFFLSETKPSNITFFSKSSLKTSLLISEKFFFMTYKNQFYVRKFFF